MPSHAHKHEHVNTYPYIHAVHHTYANNKYHNQNSCTCTHALCSISSSHQNTKHTMSSTYTPDMGHLTRRAIGTRPRMLGWCQVWFWCRSITSTISECVALWKTSRWLRWNVVICFWDLNPTLLDMIAIIQHSSHTQPFIRDDYQSEGGERHFKGDRHRKISRLHS